jgi:putative transposase
MCKIPLVRPQAKNTGGFEMKRKRFTEAQIHEILKESDAGVGTAELCRKHGISQNTFYRWKSKYGGMELGDIQRMKQIEDENSRLRRIIADQALDIQALKAVVEKKW